MSHHESKPAEPREVQTVDAVIPAPNGGRMLTRPQAANELGVSVTELRRLEQKVLPAVRDARGYHLHSEEQIVEFKVRRSTMAASKASPIDGALASAAFTMFDEGASAVELVKAHQVPPSLAEELFAKWVSMRGGFVVDGETAAKIEMALRYYVEAPINSAADIVKALRAVEPDDVCVGCKRVAPCFCIRCFQTRPSGAIAAADAIRASTAARDAVRARKATDKLAEERARRASAPPPERAAGMRSPHAQRRTAPTTPLSQTMSSTSVRSAGPNPADATRRNEPQRVDDETVVSR